MLQTGSIARRPNTVRTSQKAAQEQFSKLKASTDLTFLTQNHLENDRAHGTRTFLQVRNKESGFDNFIHLRYQKDAAGKFSDQIAITKKSDYPPEARWNTFHLQDFQPEVRKKLFPSAQGLRRSPLTELAKAQKQKQAK